MNKAQSKKLALKLAGETVDASLCAGWPFTMVDDKDCEWNEADQKRIASALDEVVDELYARGGKFDDD